MSSESISRRVRIRGGNYYERLQHSRVNYRSYDSLVGHYVDRRGRRLSFRLVRRTS